VLQVAPATLVVCSLLVPLTVSHARRPQSTQDRAVGIVLEVSGRWRAGAELVQLGAMVTPGTRLSADDWFKPDSFITLALFDGTRLHVSCRSGRDNPCTSAILVPASTSGPGALEAFFEGLRVALRGGSAAVRERYTATGGRTLADGYHFDARVTLTGTPINAHELEPDRNAQGVRFEIQNGLNSTTFTGGSRANALPNSAAVLLPAGLWRFRYLDERRRLVSDQWVLVVDQGLLESAQDRVTTAVRMGASWTGERVEDSRRSLVTAVMAGIASERRIR
jgi:hypothetical protein